MTTQRYYLDYNATAPLSTAAKEALIQALELVGNPSSTHHEGRRAKAVMQNARRQLADLLHTESNNIVFTSGASEAAATLLTPHYRMGRSALKMSHLYVGATEHPCIAKGGRFAKNDTTTVPVYQNGLINQNALDSLLSQHDKEKGLPLVAIQAANNETGIIQPLNDIARIVRQYGGVFIVDAVQYIGKMQFDITQMCGDFFLLSAHKIAGPKGIGAFVSTGTAIAPAPLIEAGGQERGLRGGTEALPLIAAFGAAAYDAQIFLKKSDRLKKMQQNLENGLMKIDNNIIIHGHDVARLSNTTLFTVPHMKAETLQIGFDLAGFAVSAGSACSSGKVGQSSTLTAMGNAPINGAIRVSTGAQTQDADINCFLEATKKIIKR